MKLSLIERKPTVEEYNGLRASVGWRTNKPDSIATGLSNSPYAVCAMSNSKVVGMVHIVGDGATCFYIQDVIVRPEYQNMSAGTAMKKKTMDYVKKYACRGAVVGLMAARGKELFYERFGFWKRPINNFGHGMTQFWKIKN